MSSFSQVLLEQGVEMDMQADMPKVVSVLDKEIPGFTCQGYGYRLTSGKGMIGVNWLMMVKLVQLDTKRLIDSPVGHLELENLDGGVVKLKIPSRAEIDDPGIHQFDPNGTYFGAFIYQILNAFQRNDLINLPGVLPVI